jgi:hypothetical protein
MPQRSRAISPKRWIKTEVADIQSSGFEKYGTILLLTHQSAQPQ